MEWLKKCIKEDPFWAMLMPTGFGIFTFIGNLAVALSDGKLDSNEIHNLMSSASGIEVFILIVIMFALKQNKK